MFNIITSTIEKELFYKGDLILKYKINYPSIHTSKCKLLNFNIFNFNLAIEQEKYVTNTLFREAVQTYEYNLSNGYPIMVYELIYDYTITYNENNIISLYFDNYIFSGGAHGSTTRTSQNWNMLYGNQFTLDKLFPDNQNYLINILQNINNQIEENIQNGNGQYFDNYCKLVLENFNLQNFYILSDSLFAIYFQQYDIAPYSSGIPVFEINYK